MGPHREFPCDICESNEAIEVPHSREYQNNEPVHICTGCGFVYVKHRRSSEDIGKSWSNEVFGNVYTARIPAVKARHTYVAEFVDSTVGFKGKRVCDIGAGEGQLLEILTSGAYQPKGVFGIEPSPMNCKNLTSRGFDCFEGTIEQFLRRPSGNTDEGFDIVLLTWTLENGQQCRVMLDAVWDLLKPGGHVVVATGSRILVPFKKPLHLYLSKNPADTNCFRFSANTLSAALAKSHFKTEHLNRYLDSDILCAIGKKSPKSESLPWKGDPYLDVYSFFERWHAETELYYKRTEPTA